MLHLPFHNAILTLKFALFNKSLKIFTFFKKALPFLKIYVIMLMQKMKMGYYVMKQFAKRSISLVVVLMLLFVMCFTSVSASTPATGYSSANDVVYKTYSLGSSSSSYSVTKGIINWGARGEDCYFLSKYAQSYYKGNNTYAKLSALKGGSSQTNAPGTALYNALQTLMKVNFTHSYQKTRDMYKYTDCVSNNTSKLVSFYSGTLVNSTWDGGATFNREHCWPDSKCLSSGRSEGDSADMHMLRPTKSSENGSRGNKAYGTGSGYFEPSDEVKGDCARIVLYCYVRWGNTGKMWGTSGVMKDLNTLLEWMELDPVDTWEMGRNDAVQSITGNRNVFVDYPEFAWLLFGKAVPTDMVTPSGENLNGSGSNDNNDNSSSNTSSNTSSNNSSNTSNKDDDENYNDNDYNDDDTTTGDNDNNYNDDGIQGGIDNKPQNEGKPFDPNNIGVQTGNSGFVMAPWIIALIVAGGLVVVAGITAAVIIIVKKKK